MAGPPALPVQEKVRVVLAGELGTAATARQVKASDHAIATWTLPLPLTSR